MKIFALPTPACQPLPECGIVIPGDLDFILEAPFLCSERAPLEKDFSWKQIIPYIILVHTGKVLVYQRVTGDEKRLNGKKSIGIGGHIDEPDGSYWAGFQRELLEELSFQNSFLQKHIIYGIVNDDSDEVGRVHLGVVHVVELEAGEPRVEVKDPKLRGISFATPNSLLIGLPDFENWSQLCIWSLGKILKKLDNAPSLPPDLCRLNES
jgi:predicted NUDIX family phosphoesterase